MKLCYAVLHYDPSHTDPGEYLNQTPIHRELPREMARLGHQVEVIHLFPIDAEFVEDGVRYRFMAPGLPARLSSKVVSRLFSRHDPAVYEPAARAIGAIHSSRPDLIHFHSVTLHWNLFLLLHALAPKAPPLVLHYHGGYPASNPLAQWVQRFNFSHADRLLFTTTEHALPFLKAGILKGTDRLVEFMETSSSFRPQPRTEARGATGMEGSPVFLWVGRLDPIKDPLTALRGFEQIALSWPQARLYLHYLTDELLPEMQAFVAAHPHLLGRVEFRGRAPFDRMEQIYNSADFLLQASHREFSGCAVLEAMACGVIPVVTDIPSFRRMTDGGRYGVLFPPGDAQIMASRTLDVATTDIPARSTEVRRHFECALSFPALAMQLHAIYRDLAEAERYGRNR